MRQQAAGLVLVLIVAGTGGPAWGESQRAGLLEDAGRALGEVTDQLRGLGAQIERHFRGWGEAASPAERPLVSFMLERRDDLGLTEEQVRRLEGLRGEFVREAIRRDAEIRIAEMDLAGLLAEEPPDLPRVEAKIRQLAGLRAELRIARLRTIEQGRTVLTPEQRARLAGLLGARTPRRTADRVRL